MDIALELGRPAANDHVVGREALEREIDQAGAGDAGEDAILAQPAKAARPVALPATASARRGTKAVEVGVLRVRAFGQPQHAPAGFDMGAQRVGHGRRQRDIGLGQRGSHGEAQAAQCFG
ncbi:hypothetical protein SE17_26900 [Kouleothrix aurantiaca]|uniref:Uncharacterized protein n=1 Tax=Kouleothrix aurantiaca TaxID=186479 RepID=A0A0P9F1Y4_9CHLR|nr:hypothetical protein SE17_26900 [Kouleothrix aurantiaca]